MRNYKLIVPIVLIFVFAVSIYLLYDAKKTKQEEYDTYLEEARYFRSIEIDYDAELNYQQAANIFPSMELYREIAAFYIETEQAKATIEWGNRIIEEFPEDFFGYEYLMEEYYKKSEFISCFEIYDIAVKRNALSNRIKEIFADIEYEYYLTGSYENVGVFDSDVCPVSIGGLWGFVGNNGGVTIPIIYNKVGYFGDERSSVVLEDDGMFYIDKNNHKRIKIVKIENPIELGRMEGEVFSLFDGEQWNFYSFANRSEELIFGGFDDVTGFYNGMTACLKDGKWTLHNNTGADLTGQTFSDVIRDERGAVYVKGRVFSKTTENYVMTDAYGKNISDLQFEDVKHFCESGDYAAVKINGKWGFINANGEVVIEPQYEDARSFSFGFAAVKINDLWGFINNSGELVIDAKFMDAKDFNTNGCVFIKETTTWQLLKLIKYNH